MIGPGRTTGLPGPIRRSDSRTQLQASGLGGLVAVSALKPEAPTVSSSAFSHAPSETIFSSAVLILPHSSVSPFLMPTP